MESLSEDYQKGAVETDSNKMLNEYLNVKYPLIHITEGQENVEVQSIYPPPHLYTSILASINNVLNKLRAMLIFHVIR